MEESENSTSKRFAVAGAVSVVTLVVVLIADLILFTAIGLNVPWLMLAIGLIEIVAFFSMIFCSFMMTATAPFTKITIKSTA